MKSNLVEWTGVHRNEVPTTVGGDSLDNFGCAIESARGEWEPLCSGG